MRQRIEKSIKWTANVIALVAIFSCIAYIIIAFNGRRKWVVTDSEIDVEEVERFTDGDDTCVVIRIFDGNKETISTYTKHKKQKAI